MAQSKNTGSTTSKKRSSGRSKLTEKEKAERKALEEAEKERLRKRKLLNTEIFSILVIAVGVFFILSMLTNACGMVGSTVEVFLKGILGKVAYVLPFFMVVLGILVFLQRTALLTWRSVICTVFFFLFLSALVAVFVPPLKGLESYELSVEGLKAVYRSGAESGGFLGVVIGAVLLNTVGPIGLRIISVVGMIIMLMFIIDTPISKLFDDMKLRREAKSRIRAEKRAEREQQRNEEMAAKLKEEQLKIEETEKNKVKITEAASSAEIKQNVSKALPVLDMTPFAEPVDSTDGTFTEDPEANSIEELSPREYIGEDITENKRRILDYVTDDGLFSGRSETAKGFGYDDRDVMEKYAPKSADEPEEEKNTSNEELAPQASADEQKKPETYKFPPISLLNKSSGGKNSGKNSDLTALSRLLENTLQSFGVSAKVVDVVKGPAVTRFEVQPAPGVQVSKIVHLQDDIALNLRAKSIRIEAPIPGKAAVGIEVSNDTTQSVLLRDLIDSKEFKSHKSKIAVTLGKSISGENIICDIHEMPHLLIGGTTGSGKSVCMDSMLVSLLYHARPDEVKLILIDPKIVELTPFNGIPHLMIPVVTEPNKAAVALSWAVNEMNDRYNKFAEEGVKDLQSYNESVKFKGQAELRMPEVIIVIDELADLIMAAKNQVEDSICRIAQKARAAGMHLVIATQRPSADVITGVIKANIPSRIALSVSSSIDSRVILDVTGAENLLGKGDMLYSPQSLSKPIRVQGTFISDNELHAVIDFVKSQDSGEYNGEIMNAMDKVGSNSVGGGSSDDDSDELFMDALETVVSAEQCSVSMLQRRFRIGYNRAARLVDMMEERGMVGPADGSKPRKVLMTKSELEEYKQRTDELDYGM